MIQRAKNDRSVRRALPVYDNAKEFIRIFCIVEKCWKIAFHLKVDRKRGGLVVSVLAFNARGHGFDPISRQENISVTEHAFLCVICRDDTR